MSVPRRGGIASLRERAASVLNSTPGKVRLVQRGRLLTDDGDLPVTGVVANDRVHAILGQGAGAGRVDAIRHRRSGDDGAEDADGYGSDRVC